MNKIKELREDNDIKQIQLAKILNITQAQYSRIENNEYELSYDGLIKLALFYNTSIDYILGLTNVKKKSCYLQQLLPYLSSFISRSLVIKSLFALLNFS